MFVQNGVITFVSAITPKQELRNIARGILGNDLFEVFIDTSYQTCEQRDVKGLYAKAARGEIAHFTGKDSGFEIPALADLVLRTEGRSVEDSSLELLEAIRHKILFMPDAAP
jgi:adenylylsulfate kinase